MPAYFDEKTKTWYCKFNYTDWQVQKKQKMKRGFQKKKDAKEWESRFIAAHKYDEKTTIGTLADDFLEEMKPRRRYNTISAYTNSFKNYIKPYLADLPLGELTDKHIIEWQNRLLESDLSETYINKIDTHFRTLFHFGARRCRIIDNPFDNVEKIGKARAKEMNFWTLEQYRKFIALINDPEKHMAFELLYYTGIRLGELLPLTVSNIDTQEGILHVSQSLQRIKRQDIVTPPKTEKGIRDIVLPKFLCNEIKEYEKRIYGCTEESRLFSFKKSSLYYPMKKYSQLAGIPAIRLHDLRHSHVALLIEKNVSPMVIAERLGHESVDITLGTYGHLYPNKQKEVAEILDAL